jgi:hypothetical protein
MKYALILSLFLTGCTVLPVEEPDSGSPWLATDLMSGGIVMPGEAGDEDEEHETLHSEEVSGVLHFDDDVQPIG